MKYWVKMPPMVKWTLRKAWWHFADVKNEIYLTFDDGPNESITPFVLDALSESKAQATFFLTGQRALLRPALVQEMLNRGHAIGSHSHSHLDGWKVNRSDWLADVLRGHDEVEQAAGRKVKLFRPPYGKMPRGMASQLPARWQAVMWNVMPGDFDLRKKSETVLADAMKHTKPGSIVVLHDSEKAEPHLRSMLPPFLSHVKAMGWNAAALPVTASE